MYPTTFAEAKKIIVELKKTTRKITRAKTIICAPALFIHPLIVAVGKVTSLQIGAQNTFWEDEGARTGEISPKQLRGLGVTQVILGHSERRTLGETNAMIAQKAVQAVKNKLTVVLCVGEQSRDEHGGYITFVREQLRESLANFPKTEAKHLIVAYEPIWAIGSKAVRAAEPRDFHEMSILIRRGLVEQFGKTAGFKVPILYGGSVDERNALGFLKEGGADGLLVGRVSLDPLKFAQIIQLAQSVK